MFSKTKLLNAIEKKKKNLKDVYAKIYPDLEENDILITAWLRGNEYDRSTIDKLSILEVYVRCCETENIRLSVEEFFTIAHYY